MRFARLVVVPGLALLLAGCSGSSGDQPAAKPSEAASAPTAQATAKQATATLAANVTRAQGPPEHDGKRTLAHIVMLANTIGSRVAGTPGEAAAAKYIADQFRADGYDVEVMDFSYEGDRFRAGTVGIDGAASMLDAESLGGSAGGKVSGVPVYVGLADAAGIGGRSLQGKVAVADRGTLRFVEKFDNVKAAGAVALVLINNQVGSINGTLGKPADIPVVAVASTAGDQLRAAVTAAKRITIEVPQGTTSHALDVVARPRAGAACRILVGGHHDSVPGTGAANDNASGAAHVIELARAFAADGIDEGLCFATFGAEESGLFGSKALVDRLRTEGGLPRVMINLDVTGIGTEVELIGDARLKKEALGIAATLGIPAASSSLPANAGSDHQSFQDAGVPILYLTSGDFGTIHTPQDVTGDIDPQTVEELGDLAYACIKQILGEVA